MLIWTTNSILPATLRRCDSHSQQHSYPNTRQYPKNRVYSLIIARIKATARILIRNQPQDRYEEEQRKIDDSTLAVDDSRTISVAGENEPMRRCKVDTNAFKSKLRQAARNELEYSSALYLLHHRMHELNSVLNQSNQSLSNHQQFPQKAKFGWEARPRKQRDRQE